MANDYEEYDPDDWDDLVERFADPGGDSALYPAGSGNPREHPCPTCHFPDRLTYRDVVAGYQCNACADAMERGMDVVYYEGTEG